MSLSELSSEALFSVFYSVVHYIIKISNSKVVSNRVIPGVLLCGANHFKGFWIFNFLLSIISGCDVTNLCPLRKAMKLRFSRYAMFGNSLIFIGATNFFSLSDNETASSNSDKVDMTFNPRLSSSSLIPLMYALFSRSFV